MNRNRHNVPRDDTTRAIRSQAPPPDADSWLRTLRAIRGLGEVAT